MPTKKTNPNSLLTALDFIAPVMERKGTLSETHCSLSSGQCSAFNGLIAMGAPIAEDITAYPAHAPLRAALAQAKDGCGITVKDNGSIYISAGPFRATIKGVRVNQVQATLPDPQQVPLDDNFRTMLPTLAKVIKEEDTNAAKCSLMVSAGSLVATDGVIFLEYWHGFSLPNLMLPKEAVGILANIKEQLTGFGYTPNRSATFWFGKFWFKTLLIDGPCPNLSFITSLPTTPKPIPMGFTDAIAAVRAHSEDEDSALYFAENALQSHSISEEGAIYEVAGLPTGQIFNGKHLALVAELATGIDFFVKLRDTRILGFIGNKVRGWLMPRLR